MNLSVEIKSLVLSFFKVVNSDVIENHNTYEISIPQEYHRYFKSSKIIITFDKDTADSTGAHLIIPGSNILYTILTICKQKGPIRCGKAKISGDSTMIRYHFYVNFSGTHDVSKLDHVDVSLNDHNSTDTPSNELLFDGKINPKDITSSYLMALEQIKKSYEKTRAKFLDDANKEFNRDFMLFVNKYDTHMRELDHSINAKEQASDDIYKTREFRFKTVEKIKEIDREKSGIIRTIQEKHQVLIEYNLVACEIFGMFGQSVTPTR